MSWINEDDQLMETRRREIEARFEAYMRECRHERKCASCQVVYRPLLSMGKLECRVHPENLLHGEPLGTVLLERGLSGAKSKLYHYPCCGAVNSEKAWDTVAYGGWISRRGCCRSDHVASMNWRSIGDAESNVIPANFMRMNVASTNIQYESEACSLRLRVLPVALIVALYNKRHVFNQQSEERETIRSASEALNEHINQETVIKINDVMGPNTIVVSTAGELLNKSKQLVTLRSGTLSINFNLRNAYTAMCMRFGLPREFLENALTSLDLEMRQQQQRLKQQNALNAQTTARMALYPEEEEEREMDRTAALMGEHDMDLVDDMRSNQEFYPFAVSSWIEPYKSSDVNMFLRIPLDQQSSSSFSNPNDDSMDAVTPFYNNEFFK
jgi:hypothetical protein